MRLLCEPYLLDPRPGGVGVFWHTDSPGARHVVLVGAAVATMPAAVAAAAATGDAPAGPGWRRVTAVTTALSRTREDAESVVADRRYRGVVARPVYRQAAVVAELPAGRTPYRVVSVDTDGTTAASGAYTLAPAPPPTAPVRLLLSSDHQLKPMVPANLAAVARTAGVTFDGVLMAGDLVNVADRASDWFDNAAAPSFFAAFQGRAAGRHPGAPILQHSPLYPCLGNHEVMGPESAARRLAQQFDDARPGAWDVTTYCELFPVPASGSGGARWWSRTIGDLHVISLFATQIWRPPRPDGRPGRYAEDPADLAHPRRWGHGQFIFEPIGRGSEQFAWLERELASPAARAARYRVVMFHHPSHGLGQHSVPPYTDPVPTVARDPGSGAVTGVTYHYPLGSDHILRDLEPLFDSAGVHLVLNGHSHIWNRFSSPAGVNWLETSNVGNSYGAYHATLGRLRHAPDDYVRQGDPGGLEPVVPTIAPLTAPDGTPLPFLASDDITAFSILDSAGGVVRSYRYDTREPDPPVVLFDEFSLA